jgi:hypothetical protein
MPEDRSVRVSLEGQRRAGGPAFNWVDITGVGTAIPFVSDDANLGSYPIGFSFPFYGNSFSTVRVCTNGWLSFTNSVDNDWTNQTLPTSASYPENLVAPFWDDLNFTSTGDAYTQRWPRFIVSWVNAPPHRRQFGGPYTFSDPVSSGRIDLPVPERGCAREQPDVGIQNGTRTTRCKSCSMPATCTTTSRSSARRTG